jgi:hypothetical protein
MAEITESGMVFGPYQDEQCFIIEKCATYSKTAIGSQIAEFILLRGDEKKICWIVEAKSSAPRPVGGASSRRETSGGEADDLDTRQHSFSAFIEKIREKLSNTFHLWLAIRLERHGKESFEELPGPFRTLDLSTLDYRLVLVIRGHEKAWLPPLQEALSKRLRPFVKIWSLSPNSVIVLNETMAKDKGLVSSVCTSPD